MGVNALTRASFISTRSQDMLTANGWKCQCPLAGFFYFYYTIQLTLDYLVMGVNALTRTSFISTSFMQKIGYKFDRCVNALWRALYISTVPLGNPHKQQVSDLISACNSQNILTIPFLNDKISLFTVCSYLWILL